MLSRMFVMISAYVGCCTSSSLVCIADDTIRIADAQVTLVGEVRLPAREAGPLTSVRVREGDLVEPGALLADIDADLLKLQEQAARSEYDVAKNLAGNDVDERFAAKSIAVAEAELRRATESVRTAPKSVSVTELERLQLVVDRAKLTAEQARRDRETAALTAQAKKAAWEAAVKHVERCRIVAPWKGLVVQLMFQPGEWIDPGEHVVRLIRIDRLRVESFVDGRLSQRDLIDRPVELTITSADEKTSVYTGRVVFVSPEVQPVTRQVRIWAEVENPQLTLRPGERGRLTISPAKREALAKPSPNQAAK